jgi:hypothetical protein
MDKEANGRYSIEPGITEGLWPSLTISRTTASDGVHREQALRVKAEPIEFSEQAVRFRISATRKEYEWLSGARRRPEPRIWSCFDSDIVTAWDEIHVIWFDSEDTGIFADDGDKIGVAVAPRWSACPLEDNEVESGA